MCRKKENYCYIGIVVYTSIAKRQGARQILRTKCGLSQPRKIAHGSGSIYGHWGAKRGGVIGCWADD